MESANRFPSTPSRRGVSLAEAVLTLLILSMFLVVIARLMSEVSDVQRFWGSKESSAEVAVALDRVRCEVLSSIRLVKPAPGGSDAMLEFLRVDPDIDTAGSLRLPTQLSPTPSPKPAAPWDPRDATFLMTVRYTVNPQAQLVRLCSSTTSYVGPAFSQSSVLASGVASFQCQNTGGRSLWLSADCTEARRSRRYRISVYIGEGTQWL